MPGYLGNLKFPRFPKFLLESDGGGFLNILEISQVPGCLRNFPSAWVSWKFLMPWYLENLPNSYLLHRYNSVGS